MKDLNSVNESVLFNQIIMRLEKEFGKLPNAGIVAGQAVATAIYEIFCFKQKGVYNDIDIFMTYQDMSDKLRKSTKPMKSLEKINNEGKSSIFYVSSYAVDAGNIKQTSYTINSVAYDEDKPRFNYIGISYDHINSNEVDLGHIVISSFDINCCQIAINLENGKVSWTKEFQDFMYSMELKTTYLGTPMHTAIRLLKKKDEMPLFKLNVEQEMFILQTSREFMKQMEENKKGKYYQYFPGNLFSDTYLERFKKYEQRLSKYFSLSTKIIKIHRYQNEIVIENERSKCMKIISKKSQNNEMMRYSLYRKYWVINPKAHCKATVSAMMDYFANDGEVTIDKPISLLRAVYNLFNSDSKKVNLRKDTFLGITKNFKRTLASNTLMYDILGNPNSHLHGQSIDAIRRFIKFTNKHPHLMTVMSEHSLNEIFLIVKMGNWLEKNKMSFIIGKYESRGCNNLFDWLQPNFKEQAREEFEHRKERLSKLSTKPLFESIIKDISNECTIIEEITNAYRLSEEGDKQRHCVGGYWDSIECGRYSIFSIKTSNENQDEYNRNIVSTLCISLKEMNIQQHYGVGNSKVNKSHEMIAKNIMERIQTIASKYSERRISESSEEFHKLLALGLDRKLFCCEQNSLIRKTRIKRRHLKRDVKLNAKYKKAYNHRMKNNINQRGFLIDYDDSIPF